MHSDLSDKTLLTQIMANNADALATLYDRHAQTAYNLIFRIVRDEAVADELLQETFWQVWQKPANFAVRGK
jgi:RNA polymerase sigma-70 factor (ECF subfamily)